MTAGRARPLRLPAPRSRPRQAARRLPAIVAGLAAATAAVLAGASRAPGWRSAAVGFAMVTSPLSELGLPPISERVFLITGSTDGIGKFTAEQLAQQGCTVLLHGRNPQKIESTMKELSTLAPEAKLHGFQADLSSMAEVRRLAQEVSSSFPVIHGLLNNAGTFDGDYTGKKIVTEEGNEYSLAVNVMAPFLLTSLLLENVRASGAGRILVTSSISSGAGDALDDLQLEKGWSGHRAYSLSKLCDAMMVAEMHERFADAPKLTFHTMDPGTVDTKMLRAGWFDGGASVRTATKSFRMLTDDSYQQSSGSNIGLSEVRNAHKRRKLWEELERLTGADWPAGEGGA